MSLTVSAATAFVIIASAVSLSEPMLRTCLSPKMYSYVLPTFHELMVQVMSASLTILMCCATAECKQASPARILSDWNDLTDGLMSYQRSPSDYRWTQNIKPLIRTRTSHDPSIIWYLDLQGSFCVKVINLKILDGDLTAVDVEVGLTQISPQRSSTFDDIKSLDYTSFHVSMHNGKIISSFAPDTSDVSHRLGIFRFMVLNFILILTFKMLADKSPIILRTPIKKACQL